MDYVGATVAGTHPGLVSNNADSLRVVWPAEAREALESLFCMLWVIEQQNEGIVELFINVFSS